MSNNARTQFNSSTHLNIKEQELKEIRLYIETAAEVCADDLWDLRIDQDLSPMEFFKFMGMGSPILRKITQMIEESTSLDLCDANMLFNEFLMRIYHEIHYAHRNHIIKLKVESGSYINSDD
jgi:hypothetical protein